VQGVGTVFPHVPPPFYTCIASYSDTNCTCSFTVVPVIEDIHGLVVKHLKPQTLFDLK